MKQKIKNLAVDAGILNYVDHETPRYYFLDTRADVEDIEQFAKLMVKECADFVREFYDHEDAESIAWNMEIQFDLHGDY